MAYRDFTLEEATWSLGVTTEEANLCADAAPVAAPDWLVSTLGKRTQLALQAIIAQSDPARARQAERTTPDAG